MSFVKRCFITEKIFKPYELVSTKSPFISEALVYFSKDKEVVSIIDIKDKLMDSFIETIAIEENLLLDSHKIVKPILNREDFYCPCYPITNKSITFIGNFLNDKFRLLQLNILRFIINLPEKSYEWFLIELLYPLLKNYDFRILPILVNTSKIYSYIFLNNKTNDYFIEFSFERGLNLVFNHKISIENVNQEDIDALEKEIELRL